MIGTEAQGEIRGADFSALPACSPRSLRSSGIGAAVVMLCGAASLAQDLTVKAPAQSQPIAVVNATVHPVSGPVIEGGHVVFEGGRITAVGQGPYTLTGPGTVIDATGKHVWPGLIGAVTQIGLTEIQAVRATVDIREVNRVSPEAYAAVAVNPDSTIIPVTRANGVLAVGVFPQGGVIPGRASVIRLEGWTWEDMAIRRDAGIALNWPMMRTVTAWWMDQSEDDQQRRMRESLDAVDAAFDAAEAYVKAKEADGAHLTDVGWEAMRGVLASAGEKQLPVFISAQDVDQITASVTWALDRGLRPVVVGGQDAPLCADLLKSHNVPVIVVGTHTFPKRSDSEYDGAYTLPARLEEAGILWCLASTDDTAHERNLPYNAAIAVAHGLDHEAAIRGLTLNAARILGVAGEIGSLEAGKAATLFISDGSPLEVTTKIERAFIDGRAIDLSSKHTKLAEKYREKYRQLGEVRRTP